jgi:hypothetical protein
MEYLEAYTQCDYECISCPMDVFIKIGEYLGIEVSIFPQLI